MEKGGRWERGATRRLPLTQGATPQPAGQVSALNMSSIREFPLRLIALIASSSAFIISYILL